MRSSKNEFYKHPECQPISFEQKFHAGYFQKMNPGHLWIVRSKCWSQPFTIPTATNQMHLQPHYLQLEDAHRLSPAWRTNKFLCINHLTSLGLFKEKKKQKQNPMSLYPCQIIHSHSLTHTQMRRMYHNYKDEDLLCRNKNEFPARLMTTVKLVAMLMVAMVV